MNFIDNNIGSSSASFSFIPRDASVSDSIQSSHNSSIGDSQESLTSPVGASYGLTLLPVKDSLAGLAISQQNTSWTSPSYTSANQFQTSNLYTNQSPIPSVVESSNKVLISMPQQQIIQIIQSPNGIAIPTSQTTELMQMPNNNNSSNREIEELAVTTHIESFKKPSSRLYAQPGNPAPTPDSLVNSQFYSISQNDVTVPMSHAPHAPLLQGADSPRFILSSQPGASPDTFQIIQAISKPGQQPAQNIGPMQQLIFSSVPEGAFPPNQPNGNIHYSIIAPTFANAAGPPQAIQAMKPVSPPRQAKGHKHLQNYPFNSRPNPAHIKLEPGAGSYVQVLGNPPLLQQTSAPDLEPDRQRSEFHGSGPGPRKRKTGVPRKYVQHPKVKKERSEGGEEMDYSQEGDDNSDELSGSPFGTESFPEMEYSPDSDSCSFAPSSMEQQLFPRIMLTEGSKVTFTSWNKYCQLTGSRPAPYALHNQNNSLLPESNLFQVGTNLEILERTPDRHFAIRPVTVTKTLGSRLRLELLASAGGQSLWTTVDSYRLHYLGWGSERGLTYLPPDDLLPNINWQEYMHSILAVQDNSNIDMFRASFDQEMASFFTLFRPGMLLEAAMDPLNRELISVCVVKRCSGQTVLLYEQNEDELSEFSRFYQEFSVDSPYIRPLGWANKHRKQLRPSKESSNSKDWPHLLAKIIIHKNRLPVPLEAFSRTSCFCPGMKLEAVDWKEPEKIRVATVIAVNDKQQIKVHYDGLPADTEHWADVDGKDIFPPGYCDTTGHQLEKPVELDISQAAPALLCPMSYRFPAQTTQPPLARVSPKKPDSPPREELTSSPARPPPVQVLQHKVTVTLYVSHASFPGPYLNPELFHIIPAVIGPTSPTQAQAMLLIHLLDASVNRPLLWDKIEESPGPNAIPLLYEPNSNICKQLPYIESFHDLFLFVNKLREKLEFGPDFIRIGVPPANHEVHQPEKIPSSIPPLTLPQSKYAVPAPTQPHPPPSVPNQFHLSNRTHPVPPQAVSAVHPDPSMVQPGQPLQNMPMPSAPRNVNMFQNKPPTPPYRSAGTNTRPVLQISTNPIILTETTSTNVIPPPSNYVNGNSHSPTQVVSLQSNHPSSWTVEQVCDFIRTIDQANLDDVVSKFREQKIDGASLIELKVELLIHYLKLELGPALKIMRHIEQLISNTSPRRESMQPPN